MPSPVHPAARIPHTPIADGPFARRIHLAPANGFPPRTYAPLFTGLGAFSVGPRPLWNPPPPTEAFTRWSALGPDLLAGLDAHADALGPGPFVGVGHSFGALATVSAALAAPHRFSALIVLDPTVFARHTYWALRIALLLGQRVRLPLAQGARRRRARFGTHDEAFAYWRAKPLFADWNDDALWAYVRAALQPDGDGYTLVWPAEWEARIYETIEPATWGLLNGLRRLNLPILFLRGATSTVFTAKTAAAVRRMLPNADMAEMAGHGHLFPLSAPAATGEALSGWLARYGLSADRSR